MQKIIVGIVSITLIMLTVIAFQNNAMAAQVIRVNKLSGDVGINGGEDAGFVIGATVCFFTHSGKKLVCGTVTRASASEALVKVDRRWSQRILGGSEALLYKEGENKTQTEEVEGKIKKEETTQKTGKTNKENWFR